MKATARIIEVLEISPATSLDISLELNYPLNSISALLTQLYKSGFLTRVRLSLPTGGRPFFLYSLPRNPLK